MNPISAPSAPPRDPLPMTTRLYFVHCFAQDTTVVRGKTKPRSDARVEYDPKTNTSTIMKIRLAQGLITTTDIHDAITLAANQLQDLRAEPWTTSLRNPPTKESAQ